MTNQEAGNVNELIARIEAIAKDELEQPDGITTQLDYAFNLQNSHRLALNTRHDNEEAGYMGAGFSTAVFLNRTVEVPELPGSKNLVVSNQVVFSCLHDSFERGEPSLGGIFSIDAADMPEHIPDNSAAEKLAWQKVAAVGRHIQEINLTTVGFFNITLELIKQDKKFESLLSESTEAIHQLLAEGFYSERRFKQIDVREVLIYLESHARSGPTQHADARRLAAVPLSLSFTEGDLHFTFEKTTSDMYETKMVIANPHERYRYYQTFAPLTDVEGGESNSYTIDRAEIERYEQVERDAGMYVPTQEKLEFFLKVLGHANP